MTFPRWALWILLLCAALPAAARAQPAASPGAQGSPQILFEQPMLGGIAGNFHVPPAEHKYPADKPFNLVLWQPNPTRPEGQLVPTDWKAGDRTGFYPAAPLPEHQAAFRNAAGASTVQIDGGTVGVYLNSHDLPKGSPGNKMMITPAFKPVAEQRVSPFARPALALANSLELQVPSARDLNQAGNFTYVVAIFVFEDRQTRTQISYEAVLFHHTVSAPGPQTPDLLRKNEVGAYDEESHSFQSEIRLYRVPASSPPRPVPPHGKPSPGAAGDPSKSRSRAPTSRQRSPRSRKRPRRSRAPEILSIMPWSNGT